LSPFSNVSPKKIICFGFSPCYWPFNSSLPLLTWPSWRSLGNSWVKCFGLLTGAISVSIGFFLIFHGWKIFISIKFIVLRAYLRYWALVAPIIIAKFLLDYHPYLLETINANNLIHSFSKPTWTCCGIFP